MEISQRIAATQHLSGFITDRRKARIEGVLRKRTRYISVILENIYQDFNASACLRSCDCFGIQDVHVIENAHTFKPAHGVSLGAQQWLSLHRYNNKDENTADAIAAIKARGYRVLATSPLPKAKSILDIDLHESPVAVMMGAEVTGLSEEAFNLADEIVTIPMRGFSESFNISVSTALCLSHLREKLERNGIAWQLSEEELTVLRHEWYRVSVRSWQKHEQQLFGAEQPE